MSRHTQLRLAALAVSLLVTALTSPLARAQDQSPAQKQEKLEQRISILERKLENAEEEAATRAKSGATVSAGERGFSIRSNDGQYDLKLRLLAQADWRSVLDAGNAAAARKPMPKAIAPAATGLPCACPRTVWGMS